MHCTNARTAASSTSPLNVSRRLRNGLSIKKINKHHHLPATSRYLGSRVGAERTCGCRYTLRGVRIYVLCTFAGEKKAAVVYIPMQLQCVCVEEKRDGTATVSARARLTDYSYGDSRPLLSSTVSLSPRARALRASPQYR